MPVKTMATSEAVGGGDDLGVADRAAGLDDGGGAGFGDDLEAVGEGEEGVGGGDGAGEREDSLHGAEAGGVDAATSGRRRCRRSGREPSAKRA